MLYNILFLFAKIMNCYNKNVDKINKWLKKALIICHFNLIGGQLIRKLPAKIYKYKRYNMWVTLQHNISH